MVAVGIKINTFQSFKKVWFLFCMLEHNHLDLSYFMGSFLEPD